MSVEVAVVVEEEETAPAHRGLDLSDAAAVTAGRAVAVMVDPLHQSGRPRRRRPPTDRAGAQHRTDAARQSGIPSDQAPCGRPRCSHLCVTVNGGGRSLIALRCGT
jgi:hypothetical protein